MIDMEKISKEGFKILNGRLYDKHGVAVLEYDANLREFGWSNPCTEYHFTNSALSEYYIVKAIHYDEWYLKKGCDEICRLRRLGEKNWETYYI